MPSYRTAPPSTYNTSDAISQKFQNPIFQNPFTKNSLALDTGHGRNQVGKNVPKIINYCADQGGCAFWRMIFPTEHLLAYKKATSMIFYSAAIDPAMFVDVDAVRLQRQVSDNQLRLTQHLKKIQKIILNKKGKTFKIIWEVDDIVYPKEDIPEFNAVKKKWLEKYPDGAQAVKDIVHLCDEMSVVSNFMRSHYENVLSYKKISVIPNYMPRTWMDGFYDEEKLIRKYDAQKKKPRVLYNGSASHFDIGKHNNGFDDFHHMNDYIRSRVDDYDFIFFGGIPEQLQDLKTSGKIEFHPFGCILDYPQKMYDINSIVNFAPLADNRFNRAKSSLKLYEAGAMGIPCIAQDLDCYEEGTYRFTTADEMDAHIQSILKDEDSFMSAARDGRELANKYWLPDHLDEHVLLASTPYGHVNRKKDKWFFKNNQHQF